MSTAVRTIAVADGTRRRPSHVRLERRAASASACSGSPSGLRAAMLDQGYTEVAHAGPDVAVVLHFLDPDHARPYRRKNAPTFVVALAELDAPPDDLLRTGYPAARARPRQPLRDGEPRRGDGSAAHFVTLEQGTYAVDTGTGDDDLFFKTVFSRVEPLATSRLVIGNEFTADLAPDALVGRRHHRADHPRRRAPRRARPACPRRSRSRRSCRSATSGTSSCSTASAA